MPNSYRDVYRLIPVTVPGSSTGEIVVTNPLHQDVALPPAPDCSNDAAIAAALDHRDAPDTKYDEDLARQCYEEEVEAMCMQQRGGQAPQIDSETSCDNSVLGRLSSILPIALVPCVNPLHHSRQSGAEVSADRSRLLLRLDMYGLTEKAVSGDGNCQFRSISDQLYRSPEHHAHVRQLVVQHLRAQPAKYSPYVPEDYEQYCSSMARSSTWGDHVTLQAAADVYGVQICVLTSFLDNCFIRIRPEVQRSTRVLWLSFWAEVHYNSIYPKAGQQGAGAASAVLAQAGTLRSSPDDLLLVSC